MNNARKATNQLLDLIDDGMLDRQYVLQELLLWVSESEVAEFYQELLNSGHAEYMPAINID